MADIQSSSKIDPNSVADYAKSKGLVTEWNPTNAAALYEKSGLGTAASYTAAGKNNSAQNMALLATLKGAPTDSSISKFGTSNINAGKSVTDATGSALTSLTGVTNNPNPNPNPAPAPTPAPATPLPTLNSSGKYDIPAGTDATNASYYTNYNSNVDLENQSYTIAQQRTAQLQANIDQLKADKDLEIKAVTEEAAVGSPGGVGNTTLTTSLGNISKKWDDAISNATFDMNTQAEQDKLTHDTNMNNLQGQLSTNINTNISNIAQAKKDASTMLNTSIDNFQKVITGNPDVGTLFTASGGISSYDKLESFIQTATGMGVPQELAVPMLKTEVANAKAKQAAIDSKAASDDLAQRRADIADRSAARADTMLGLAINRDQRADETAARTQVKAIEQDFLKTNTASQSLSVGQQYLARIEAAGGEGVSALGLIDALVKLDTGGQAIRQGQTDILTESGTWGDSFESLKAKLGWSNKVGANTILTKNQVEQVKTQAKKIAAEQIKAAIPAYLNAKAGVESIKSDYPAESDKIDGYSSQLKSAETFIKTYGSAEDKKLAGLSSGNEVTPEIQSLRGKYGY